MKKNKIKVKRKLKKEWVNIIFNFIFNTLTLLLILYLYKKIILLTISLFFLTCIGFIKWKSKITIFIYIVGALFGTFAEICAIYYGAWIYPITNFANIPIWLFLAWGNASAFIYQTALEIKKLGIKD